TRNPPLRPSQADLASFQHVGRLACAHSAPHNLWSQPQFFVEVRSRLTLSFSAYRSFCQQRKEELAIVCSFSGERAVTRACKHCDTEGCAMAFRKYSMFFSEETHRGEARGHAFPVRATTQRGCHATNTCIAAAGQARRPSQGHLRRYLSRDARGVRCARR